MLIAIAPSKYVDILRPMQIPMSESTVLMLSMGSTQKGISKKALIESGDEAVQFGGTGFVDRSARSPLKMGTEIMGSSLKETGEWRSESIKSKAASGDEASLDVVYITKVRKELISEEGKVKLRDETMRTERESHDTIDVLQENTEVDLSQRNAAIPMHKVRPMISDDAKMYLKMLLKSKNRDSIHIYDEKLRAFTQRKKN